MHILITGATVKDGKTLIAVLVQDHPEARVTALCHDLLLPETATLRVVRGSLPDHETCRRALQDATLVVHLATRRETPDAACPA